MPHITHPLAVAMSGEAIAVLHNTLIALGYRISAEEQAGKYFGSTTNHAVHTYQTSVKLPSTGIVDQQTAQKLNAWLQSNGERLTSRIAAPVAQDGVSKPDKPTPVQPAPAQPLPASVPQTPGSDGKGGANPAAPSVIKGTVRDASGDGMPGLTVQVFAKRLRQEQQLATGQTQQDGFYELHYAPDASEKKRSNLFVRVLNQQGKVLQNSNILFNAREEEQVDLMIGGGVYRGKSSYETRLVALQSSLGGVKLSQLVEDGERDDISFLARDSDQSPEQVLQFAIASRLQDRTNLPPEIFYAFFSQNPSSSLPSSLLASPDHFKRIDMVVQRTLADIVSLDPATQRKMLEQAIEANDLPLKYKGQLDPILQRLQELRVSTTLEQPSLPGKTSLGTLLGASSLPKDQYARFTQLYLDHKGPSSAFWDALQQQPGFTPNLVADLQLTFELGKIVKNYPPVATALKQQFQQKKFKTVRDLAKLSVDDWKQTLKQRSDGKVKPFPDSIDGKTDDEKLTTYAHIITSRVEQLQPTATLVARVAQNQVLALLNKAQVTRFFDDNPSVDLRTTNIDRYLKDHAGQALNNIPAQLRSPVVQQVKVLQRVHRLASNAQSAQALLAQGIHSAHQIYFSGETNFIQKMGDQGVSRSEARTIYQRSEQNYATTLSRLTEFNAQFNTISPAAIRTLTPTPQLQQVLQDFPTLQSLFGSLDFCDCSECNSVLSPAAYLFDQLLFLKHRRATTAGKNAKDALFSRRPDIGTLLLNCENTNTELPYIDLVCELLEEAIVPTNTARQTTLNATELRINPQYINTVVYDQTFKGAHFPLTLSLPFNLGLEEARTYLGHIGIQRSSLMRTFQNRKSATPVPTNAAIADESFGINADEAALICTKDDAHQQNYWNEADPVNGVTVVSAFLKKSKLEFAQLRALLAVQFIQDSTNRSEVVTPMPGSTAVATCDTSQQTITNLTLSRLDLIHRFLRLWRRTPWKMWELDLLLRSNLIGKGILNQDALVQLSRFHELQTRLQLPAESLLAFFHNLSIVNHVEPDGIEDALYARLFLNNAVINPPDAAFAIANVTVATTSEMIEKHIPPILAAFSLEESDLRLIFPRTDGKLSLNNLSLIYRFFTLAYSLSLSIEDLLTLVRLLNLSNPFADIATIQTVCDAADFVKTAGFSLAQLDYLLRYSTASTGSILPETITGHISRLRTTLQKVKDEFFQPGVSKEQVLTRKLPLFPAFSQPADVQIALELIAGKWTGTAAERNAFIASHFAAFCDVTQAQTKLGVLTSSETDKAAREQEIQSCFDFVLQSLYQTVANATVKQLVGTLFQLENAQASLITSLPQPANAARTVLQALNDDALLQKTAGTNDYAHEISEASFPAMFAAMRLLHKIALFVGRLTISSPDLAWLIAHATQFGGLNLAQFPVISNHAALPFAAWQRSLQLLQLNARYSDVAGDSFLSLLDLVQSQISSQAPSGKQPVLDALSQLTNCDRKELQIIDTNLQLQLADYKDIATYYRLINCFSLLKRVGAGASSLFTWASSEPTVSDAAQIKQIVKAKYEHERWLEIAATLQDAVRERKRMALIEYLLAHPDPVHGKNWADVNDLFAYFLIDVEMGACQLTSRIVQATNSIQLFVQRCLMNLERSGVIVDAETDDGWLQWKWMKEYRLWEANRKVFLYPENWLLPEQRLDKSSFFRELEDELLQHELTDDTCETAIVHYLQKLHDTARLRVSAVYEDVEGDVVYVFAQSHDTPAIYYYRTRSEGAWSAWEKINVDIKSDHLIPVLYQGKLHLFWPIFTEKPEHKQSIPAAQTSTTPPPDPKKYWEIQLAWSVYHNGKWSPQRISDLKMIDSALRPRYAFTFRSTMSNDDLIIALYTGPSLEPSAGYATTNLPQEFCEFVFNGKVIAVNLINLIERVPFAGYPAASSQLRLYEKIQTNYGSDGRAIGEHAVLTIPELQLPFYTRYSYTRLTNSTNTIDDLYALKPRPSSGSVQLLTAAHLPYELVVCLQDSQIDPLAPFCYQDAQRAYYVSSNLTVAPGTASGSTVQYQLAYRFHDFYHPYADLFMRELSKGGVEGLFRRQIQVNPSSLLSANGFAFSTAYKPTTQVTVDNEQEIVDFSYDGAYSLYNWELFFHLPYMIACRLSQNQRFEEAIKWFHYIFDPTNSVNEPAPQRFWITKPFYQANLETTLQQRIDRLLNEVNKHNPVYEQQITAWRQHPFNPHLLARLRPVAYEKAVVMKYLDTLIAWGDSLFRQESIESINQATQLYVLAADLLGPRPQEISDAKRVTDKNFAGLEGDLDAFGNALTEIENMVVPATAAEQIYGNSTIVIPSSNSSSGTSEPLPTLHSFYFGIPANDRLLRYWDTVEDRLFKIRHCMNIDGTIRQLPLFAAPINPGLLIRAQARGVDLNSVLNDLNAPLPPYRFQVISQRAQQLCSEVKALGQALLLVLEKRDAEGLALLRSSHEVRVQSALRDIRQQQITEAEQAHRVMVQAKELVQERRNYYASRQFVNGYEQAAVKLTELSLLTHGAAIVGDVLAGTMFLIPDFQTGASGFGGSPHVTVKTGGSNAGEANTRGINGTYQLAALMDKMAHITSTLGMYQRRQDEWNLQVTLADREMTQIQSQIDSLQTRLEIARAEAAMQEEMLQQTQAVDAYMREKFTNQELFDWMVEQLSAVYFQSYQLAYDMAKRAERCLRYELGLQETSYIQFGYWDSLKQGLLAGEKLGYDISRMEAAYLDQNRRELELSKHISLALTQPLQLMELKQNGACFIDLPETLFDMDYPGHYMRRTRSVSLSIPCVIGPYTSINCTLTLVSNKVRVSNLVGNGYARKTPEASDKRFVDQLAAIQSIATSHGQNDSGLFDLNFRDDRYLPFEGAGAISTWRLELPRDCNHFDFDTISDVILHLNYTARDGGEPLKSAARTAVTDAFPRTGIRLLSAAHDLPNAWYRFLHPANVGDDQQLIVDLKPERFPFFARSKTIQVTAVELLAQFDQETNLIAELTPPQSTAQTLTLTRDGKYGTLHRATKTFNNLDLGIWKLKLRTANVPNFSSLPIDKLEDVVIAFSFQVI